MADDHEERIREMERQLAQYEILIPQLIKSVDGLTTAVNALNGYVAQAKGGWKVVLATGAMIAGVIEGARALWSHLHQ